METMESVVLPNSVLISTAEWGDMDIMNIDFSIMTIERIAAALAKINRFGGHTHRGPVSVARHSVWVADRLHGNPETMHLAYEGQMHDTTEALVGDLSSRIKHICPVFRALEAHVRTQIALHFGLAPTEPPAVKLVDTRAMHHEWAEMFRPGMTVLGDWTADRDLFLQRYNRYKHLARKENTK